MTYIECSQEDEAPRLSSADIFEKHRQRIYCYILRAVRDPSEAEDLAQETFLRAHRQLGSLRDRGAIRHWLYRIATHVIYDRFRRTPSRRTVSLDACNDEETQNADFLLRLAGDSPGPAMLVEQRRMSTCVRERLGDLPDDYRMVLLLHDEYGLTNPEIAEKLGCSLATVKIRLHRARRRLADVLTRSCDFRLDERGVVVCDPKAGLPRYGVRFSCQDSMSESGRQQRTGTAG